MSCYCLLAGSLGLLQLPCMHQLQAVMLQVVGDRKKSCREAVRQWLSDACSVQRHCQDNSVHVAIVFVANVMKFLCLIRGGPPFAHTQSV